MPSPPPRRVSTVLWLGVLAAACAGGDGSGDPGTPGPGDTGRSAHPDTGGDTGAPRADRPWPTAGDGTEPFGEMDCDREQHPCNHQIRMGVGDGAGNWTLLEAPLALHASVPNVVPMDYGEVDGEPWGGLWVTYVDVFTGNLPDTPVDNVITVATVAFPWSAVQTPDGLAAVLRGEGPEPWVYRRTDTHELGFAIVDPERELIAGPDGLRHLLLVVDLDVESLRSRGQYLLESADGLRFERVASDDGRGTDPDCYPLGWDGPYPGVLPAEWAPEGAGRWACHVSGADEFTRWEGPLLAQTRTDETVRGITVTMTGFRDGAVWATGHVSADGPLTDLVESQRTDAGWTTPRTILEADTVPGTEGGLQAPTRLQLAPGVELLTFHGLITVDGAAPGGGG